MTEPLNKLNAKLLSEHLHSKFKVQLDGKDTLDLEIAEVTEPQAPPSLEQFFLVLKGPRSPRLAQRTHRMEHEKLGTFDLFVTAIAGDDQSTTYEAVFSRFRKQQS
ncbi:MAG: hypothetical protein DMG65_24365 [Candidatus Angelobacter sp. Gp1-AA117]|nr:MAG: hypothetical protein DMG65_24365 [Candidatus Angelobacter sp. Gp1-AA117]